MKKLRFHYRTFVFLLFTGFLAVGNFTPGVSGEYTSKAGTGEQSGMKLWYRQPASGWEKGEGAWKPQVKYEKSFGNPWCEALPLGNGRLGAAVFGGISHERIQLNEDTLWGGGPCAVRTGRQVQVLSNGRKIKFKRVAESVVEFDTIPGGRYVLKAR